MVIAHGPQTAVALEQQAVAVSCSNLDHGLRSAGDRLQHRRTQQPDLNRVSFGFHYFFVWMALKKFGIMHFTSVSQNQAGSRVFPRVGLWQGDWPVAARHPLCLFIKHCNR